MAKTVTLRFRNLATAPHDTIRLHTEMRLSPSPKATFGARSQRLT